MLVCTTIIESGIDMPSVNTLIVDRADLLGLGQLHQMRGRVGRGGQRAYAYLFHPGERVLSEQAYERLRTIGEHTELGSRLQDRHARPRDPGRRQPARRATSRATSRPSATTSTSSWWPRRWPRPGARPAPAPPTVSLDVPGDAHLPKDYVAAEDARLEAYRRLASVGDARRTWTTSGRSGPTATARCPPPAQGLLAVARLRAGAMARGIGEVTMSSVRPGRDPRSPTVRVSPVTLAASAQVRLRRLAPGATYREDLAQLLVPMRRGGTRPTDAVRGIIEDLIPLARCGTRADTGNMRGA